MFVSWSKKNAAHKWSDFAVKVLFCETASRTTRWCIQRRLSGMSPMQTHSTTMMRFWLLSSLPRTHSPRWKNSTNLTQHPKSIQIPAFRPDIIFVRISISKWFLFQDFKTTEICGCWGGCHWWKCYRNRLRLERGNLVRHFPQRASWCLQGEGGGHLHSLGKGPWITIFSK